MGRSRRRLLMLLAALPVLILAAALVYMLGMGRLEGRERDFWQALSWSAETLSTTGYGADHSWNHPLMVVFVMVMQFLGVFLIFLIFPIYLIPFLEERFEVRLPKTAPPMEDHIVIYRYDAAVVTLLDELKQAGLPTLVIEADPAAARRALERGEQVIFGSLDEGVLHRVGLGRARALIANGADEEDAAVTLGARQLGFGGEILALVEEPFHRRPMMLAGATAVYTPRHILGAALAARASQRVSPRVAGLQQLGRKLQVSEMRIMPSSELAGKTLAEAGLGRRTGVTVIGQWVGSRLIRQPTADMRLEANGILILVGSEEGLDRFGEICVGARMLRHQGHFVVAGHGEVGAKVVQLLRDAGEEVTVIDRKDGAGVDLVGDALDPRLVEKADPGAAQAIVLALDTDSATLFATVILKEAAPDAPVIARVNRVENVERIHGAGAEFALSISQVSGQILARRLLGEEAVAVDAQLKVLQVSSRGLAGRRAAELDLRQETGCSVVAVERGEEVIVDLGPDFRFEESDAVYLAGSGQATHRYLEAYPQA